MIHGGSAFLDDVASLRQAIGEEDSMDADHRSILMDGPSGPTCGGRSVPGVVRLEVGTLAGWRLDEIFGCWSLWRVGL